MGVEALERFIEATAAAADGEPAPARARREGERAVHDAERQLRAAGF
jgi:hypothetical protein